MIFTKYATKIRILGGSNFESAIGCTINSDCEEGMTCSIKPDGTRSFNDKFKKMTFEKLAKGQCIPENNEEETPGVDDNATITDDTNNSTTDNKPLTDAQKIMEDPSKLMVAELI